MNIKGLNLNNLDIENIYGGDWRFSYLLPILALVLAFLIFGFIGYPSYGEWKSKQAEKEMKSKTLEDLKRKLTNIESSKKDLESKSQEVSKLLALFPFLLQKAL